MKFEVDHVDYTVSDFFEVFKDKLPRIVTVTQGFHGDISDDIFDKDGVYRIHTTSTQRRVAAKSKKYHYSIPLSYPYMMCVIKKKGKVGKKQTLQEVLHNYDLPVSVRFANDQQLTVGSSVRIADRLPDLELTEMFDEIYFLANSIIDGDIYLQVVPVPLYLSKLRLAEVVGIKGETPDVWSSFNQEISVLVRDSVKFDTSYGNKDIAVYDIETLKPDETYCYLEPSRYERIYDVLKFQTENELPYLSQSYNNPSYNGLQKEDLRELETCELSGNKNRQDIIKDQRKLTLSKQKNRPLPLLPECSDSSTLVSSSTRKSDKSSVEKYQSVVPWNQANNSDFKCGHSAVKSSHEGKYATVFSDNVPSSFISVPEDDECYDTILIEEPDSVELRVSRQKRSQSHSSSNKRRIEALKKLNWGSTINKQPMPDISVKRPFPSGDTKPGTTDHNATETSQSEKPTRRSTQKTKGSSVPVNVSNERKIDVQFLTIKELAKYLKVLKLSKYIPIFESHRIDGILLMELDAEIFIKDFGLNEIEALRLWRFAKYGFVPK